MGKQAMALVQVDEIMHRCLPALAALVDATEAVRTVAGEELASQVSPLHTELNQFLRELERSVEMGTSYRRGMPDRMIVRNIIRYNLELGRELTLAQCQLVANASRDVAAAALGDLVAVGFARPVWDEASSWVRYVRATPDQD